jgi:serine/threonine protein kinase
MATQGRQVLGGRYRLLDVLGDGGMARVFRAEDARLGRVVAVKILHQHYLSQPEFVRRFEQEARLAARLSHPNIVAIYDVDRQDGAYYIVMEYVEGGSLKGLITRDAPLSPSLVTAVARQLGQALDAAHAHGVIHRDIKPENILLTPSYDVKVGDFGIARALTSAGQTATGMVMGSVSYFSPEQAQGKPATAESDLYSAGVVLYEMLTGRLPFAAGNPLATAMQHITQEPAPPRAIVPALPSAVDRVILRALSKDPAQRYHSGALLADALDAAIVTGTSRTAARAVAAAATAQTTATRAAPTHLTPTGRIARTPARPRRRVAALPLALLVLAGGGAAYAATHPNQLRDMFAGAPSGVTGGGDSRASGPPNTPTSSATTSAASTPTSSGSGLVGAVASATPTTQPPPPSATPSATAHTSNTPRPTASTNKSVIGPITADIVTARNCYSNAQGVPYPVDARNSFGSRAARTYAVVRIHHLPVGAVVAARWTFPAGLSPYLYHPGGAYAVFCAFVDLGPPGRYSIAALVNGKVVGSHSFSVVAGAAPATGTQFVAPNNAPAARPAAADQSIAGNGRGYGKGHGLKDKAFKGGGNGHGNGNGNNSGNMASVG